MLFVFNEVRKRHELFSMAVEMTKMIVLTAYDDDIRFQIHLSY